MEYDLNHPVDLARFETRVLSLKLNKKRIELTEIRQNRTIKQNSYLHVVLSLYGIDSGYTLEEAKTLFKRLAGLVYEKDGNKFLKSTSDMDTKELTDFIEFIREKSSIEGCYIPTSEEYLTNKYSIDKEIDNHKNYL